MSSSRAVEIIRVAISPLNSISKAKYRNKGLNLPVGDQETPYWPLWLGCHCERAIGTIDYLSYADACHLGSEKL